MIKLFEAFAGYGTASFALKELGAEFELVGFSEIDKYAIQCFEQNHGGKNFGDITKIDWGEVPDFDLLTGGFPCQAFSTAGKQLGEADFRGQLGLELTRALIAKQPKYFLFENVKGFMSKKFTETREKFIKSWEDAGYNVTYKVLNTKDFGVPQNRERVWFIGIRKDVEKEFEFPEPFELKLKLKDILESNVDMKYFLRQEQVDKLLNSTFVSRRNLIQKKDFCSALKASDYKDPKAIMFDVSQIRREGEPIVYEEISRTLNTAQGGGNTPLILNPYNGKNSETECGTIGTSTGTITGKTSQLIFGCAVRAFPRTGSNDENRVQQLEIGKEECANSITNVQKDSMVMTTLTQATGNRAGSSKEYIEHVNRVAEVSNQVRRLTPVECFRLQGFLKDEVNLDGLSDTQKYKLAGNGQSVNVVKLILKELLK
ncbi:MAG TPA: DNA (cytosine-5-)-methyltransferase [Candidatus Cloacimonas acidaminovorans]|nr:DNA (cytosine-5-)-methyltransferase [Candidatus Cloacimonas acidaminovorans]